MLPISSAAVKGPPTKKKASLSSFPLESLPEELVSSCLARVSSPELAALPFVSKRYRSLVASSEFKELRSQLGCTEECLYICLYNYRELNPSWYVIRRDKTLNSLFMSPIPPCPSPRQRSAVVVRDWGIYVSGGTGSRRRTSDVFLLDCRTNTWRNVPSMGMPRANAVSGVVDGKIYVFGGDRTESLNWGEVFDPKTQTWGTLVSIPEREEEDKYQPLYSLVMEEKVYGVSFAKGSVVYYSPSEGKWGREMRRDLIGPEYCSSWILLRGCGIDLGKLLYAFDIILGEMFWRESGEKEWKKVKGLEGHFSGDNFIHQVSNFGVNVGVIWFEDKEDDDSRVEIWCCEVSLKRVEEKCEVWGTVEWSGAVGTLDARLYRDPFGGVLYSASVTL